MTGYQTYIIAVTILGLAALAAMVFVGRQRQCLHMHYFLFVSEDYSEGGGIHDYVGAFETLGEAQAAYTPRDRRSAHVAIVKDGELRIVSFVRGYLYKEGWQEEG